MEKKQQQPKLENEKCRFELDLNSSKHGCFDRVNQKYSRHVSIPMLLSQTTRMEKLRIEWKGYKKERGWWLAQFDFTNAAYKHLMFVAQLALGA